MHDMKTATTTIVQKTMAKVSSSNGCLVVSQSTWPATTVATTLAVAGNSSSLAAASMVDAPTLVEIVVEFPSAATIVAESMGALVGGAVVSGAVFLAMHYKRRQHTLMHTPTTPTPTTPTPTSPVGGDMDGDMNGGMDDWDDGGMGAQEEQQHENSVTVVVVVDFDAG